jgi:hypothetical protein
MCDASLALAILDTSIEQMSNELSFIGFIFENEVIKNLKIYFLEHDCKFSYFGYTIFTNGAAINKDVDLIVQFANGD